MSEFRVRFDTDNMTTMTETQIVQVLKGLIDKVERQGIGAFDKHQNLKGFNGDVIGTAVHKTD